MSEATLDLELEALNPRQRAFVAEYLIDLNATQAYIRAGYAAGAAGEASHELLNNPKIRPHIERGKAHRLAAVNTTAESVLSEINALAASDVNHYMISDEGQVTLTPGAPPNAMKAIQSIKRKTRVETRGRGEDAVTIKYYDVELRLWDKPGNLKLMGRHAGVRACFDRVEVTGPDGGPVMIGAISRQIVDPKQVDDAAGRDTNTSHPDTASLRPITGTEQAI